MVTQNQIMEWAAHPDLLDKESLYELRKVVNTYPCYQLARILFLKNLYLLNMSEFKAELKKGVLYVADVSLLFYYLEGEKFAIAKHCNETKHTKYSDTDRTLALIDSFLKEDDEPAAGEMNLVPEVPVDYTSLLLEESETPQEEAPLLKGHDLIDDFLRQAEDEHHSFCRLEEENDGEESRQEEPDGFESRLEENARREEDGMSVQKEETVVAEVPDVDESADSADEEDMEDESREELAEDSSFSETLAKIYVKQQKYDKALEIIKKLNLKYPKKNAYFADQIRFLEKLIINTKSK